MTVNVETPIISFAGNGASTEFSFLWSSANMGENYVTLDDVLLTEGIEYEMEDYTPEYGGRVVFYTAPASGTTVVIYRRTPITQQVDYVEGDPFPTDTHEFQMDKDTRILQELRVAGQSTGTAVNLAAVPDQDSVVITNTAGSDADILMWTTDGLLSGVSAGEVVQPGGPVPADGDPSTKPEGYIYWVLEALP